MTAKEMTASGTPSLSSALNVASAELADAGRKLRQDSRIREVFEGTDLEDGPDGTTVSTYLDVLMRDGPTFSWLLDGTRTPSHWNLEGSVRMDPDGNGQRAITRFALRRGHKPESFSSALRTATNALIRSAAQFDTMSGANPQQPPRRGRKPRASGTGSGALIASEVVTVSENKNLSAGPLKGVARGARASGRAGLLEAAGIRNGTPRRSMKGTLASVDTAYTVTFILTEIVQAVDIWHALEKARGLGAIEVLSVVELAGHD